MNLLFSLFLLSDMVKIPISPWLLYTIVPLMVEGLGPLYFLGVPHTFMVDMDTTIGPF